MGESSKQKKRVDISHQYILLHLSSLSGVCDEAPSVVARLLIIGSIILVIVTLPFSLCLVIKVVQVLTLYPFSLNQELS